MNVIKSFLKISFTPIIIKSRQNSRRLAPIKREIRRRQLNLPPPLPSHRSDFLEWNYKAELYSFGKRLHEDFDEDLLRQALTEQSYLLKLIEEQKKVDIEEEGTEEPHNRDMVIQGNELINNFVVRYLRRALPRFPEEGIQSIKSHLVSDDTLSHVASNLGLPELILCVDLPPEKTTLSRILKAVTSALNQSSGLDRAALFIRDFIITQLAENDVNNFWPIEDPIAVLNQICRNEGCSQPEARIIGHSGISTILALYRVGLYVDKQLIGVGPGENVKTACEMAASDALRRLFGTAEHQLNIPFKLIVDPLDDSVPNVSVSEWCEYKVEEFLKRRAASNNK